MQTSNIVNTIVDEVNQRTYVVLAPRVLTDGEIYRAIRQELLKRGSPLACGGTLTLTLTASGGNISSVSEPEPEKLPLTAASPNANEDEHFTSPPASLG
jgi:hypothetical protein